jgi:hypothetical protein
MAGLLTYSDQTIREDLTDVITNISPDVTPFLNAIGKTKADAPLHQYLTDVYGDAADNAQVEGADATAVDLVQPTRLSNLTQIFTKVIKVSGTQQAVNHAGMDKPFAYQMKKKSVEMAKDMEQALISGTVASGASGSAQRLRGVIATITTNKTAHASGTSLTEDIFNSLVANVFDSTDESPDSIYVGSRMKRAISKFTAGNTKNISAESKKLVRPVAIYESDFGVHKVKLSRFIPANAVLGTTTDLWKLAVLRPVKYEELAKVGDSKRGMIVGETTLEGLGEKANFYASGFNG